MTHAWDGREGSPSEELMAGEISYLDFLRTLHERIRPDFYLEIGVRHGHSLALASCPALGVDPAPDLQIELASNAKVATSSSDDFFAAKPELPQFDLAFIDGLHVFEQALRDFINLERHARPGALLVIDDVLPNHAKQASRVRQTRVWTGDVWKLAQTLQRYRSDLFIAAFDTHPTGSLLVAGLDPSNTILEERYDEIVAAFAEDGAPDAYILQRTSVRACSGAEFEALLDAMSPSGRAGSTPRDISLRLRKIMTPKLSVVVICYNMAREIGRTIRSLSPLMQRGLDPSDYELILIDNGSTRAFDADAVAALAGNLSIHYVTDASVSPVRAINWGLKMARAPLVGVCIDGARMASPGLLAAALEAQRLHVRPAIGTLAFHLGFDMQARSVLQGYNQIEEDRLLAASDWESDGYKLFDISVFAGSSERGWFVTPAETNALFLTAEHWRELGGYDEAFKTPGGGLANLDTWKRATSDPRALPIMILGEATFHQVHGGVATNARVSPQEAFHAEYQTVRGEPYTIPDIRPLLFGRAHAKMTVSLAASLASLPQP